MYKINKISCRVNSSKIDSIDSLYSYHLQLNSLTKLFGIQSIMLLQSLKINVNHNICMYLTSSKKLLESFGITKAGGINGK